MKFLKSSVLAVVVLGMMFVGVGSVSTLSSSSPQIICLIGSICED